MSFNKSSQQTLSQTHSHNTRANTAKLCSTCSAAIAAMNHQGSMAGTELYLIKARRAMANAYVVASESESESVNDDPLSDSLHRLSLAPPQSLPHSFDQLPDQLPRDLWTEILRHTHSSFVVDWLSIYRYDIQNPDHDYRGSAIIRQRYEFKLERRRGTADRVLRARFTRRVCPFFKRDQEWLDMTQAQQSAIENAVARSEIIAPFLELRVLVPDNPDAMPSRFYFVRPEDDLLSQQYPTMSPIWSELYRGPLLRVRDQLKTLFHMDLREQNGQLIHTPRGY